MSTQEPGARSGQIKFPINDRFVEQGFVGPLRALSPRECQRFLAASDADRRPPLDWNKGHAASSRSYYELATHPAILEVVAALLGEDVLLWGASQQNRHPNALHPWYCDIESAAASGRTVSVWIGTENTHRDSCLLTIPYSHRFGVTVQEVRHQLGRVRDATTDGEVVSWARQRDPRSHLMRCEMTDGEALFFDGRLWHGSHNRCRKTRRALLLQYATPDTEIRMSDFNLNWPFHQLNQPRPACLMVRGTAKAGVNRVVSAPLADGAGSIPQLTSRVCPLRIPLPPDDKTGWKPYPLFRGSTADVGSLSCHVSVLTKDQCPHPPHRHKDEELLLLLSGEVELILPDPQAPPTGEQTRIKSGQLIYYPAHYAHTLRTVSEQPANYMMFKWHSEPTKAAPPLAFGRFGMFGPAQDSQFGDGFYPRLVFEGPTAYLRKLHCHSSTLTPGAGYDPHLDAYDVAIIVLEGEIETLGERVGPHSVIFCPAGEPHGMHNPGQVTAKYIVFEFHGGYAPSAHALPKRFKRLLAKLTDPHRWKRKAKGLLGRFSPARAKNSAPRVIGGDGSDSAF